MEKLKLFRIYDIKSDGKCIINAKKEFIADLKTEEDALKYPKRFEELYIIKFNENDEPVGIHGMVFGECESWFDENLKQLDKPREMLPPSLDCAEHDFRVFASVAFDRDWI